MMQKGFKTLNFLAGKETQNKSSWHFKITFIPVVSSKVVKGYVKLKGVSDKQDKISNLQCNQWRLENIKGLPPAHILSYARVTNVHMHPSQYFLDVEISRKIKRYYEIMQFSNEFSLAVQNKIKLIQY